MRERYGEMYGEMHRNQKVFPGQNTQHHAPKIAELIRRTQARRLLDYGCGKGMQYLVQRVHEQWGGQLPYCYDVGIRQFASVPEGKFNGILCIDVMEHIHRDDVDEVLSHIFSLLSPVSAIDMAMGFDDLGKNFVFFHISTRPALYKTLPDGRNVHLTVEGPAWWDRKLQPFRTAETIVEVNYGN